MTELEAARFSHDCDACRFLGRHDRWDLYYCGSGARATVVARWGDHGSDYSSGLGFAGEYCPPEQRCACHPDVGHPGIPELVEAGRRARARGLL